MSSTEAAPGRRAGLLGYGLFIGLLLAGQAAFFFAGWSRGEVPSLRGPPFTDLLSSAFVHGQLHLPVEPAPELLAAKDPYDRSNRELWFWDATLYQGRYYAYWGPAPALFVAAFKALTGVESVPDRHAVLAFSLLLTLALAVFLAQLVARLPNGRLLAAALGALAVAFGSPLPFILGFPLVYSLTVVAAQAFVFLGLVFGVLGWRARGGRRTACDLACATCWTLAVASRYSLVLAVAALWLLTSAGWLARDGRQARTRVAVFALPALLGALLLGAYNQARFGSPLETGVRYQLSHPFSVGPEHVPANLYSYLLRPPRIAPGFPFVRADWHPRAPFPDFVPRPATYNFREPVTGLLFTSPFFAFALVLAFRRFRPGTGTTQDEGTAAWAVRSGLALATLPFVVPLLFHASTMRYLADVTPGLSVLSVAGLCGVTGRLADRPGARRAVLVAAGAAAVWTAVFGLLLGVESYAGFLRHANPELWQELRRLFSAS